MPALLLGLALTAYNNLLNLWGPFHRGLYIPINLAAAGGLLALAFGPLGLTPSDLGLEGNHLEAAVIGAAIGAAISAPLLLLPRLPPIEKRMTDLRFTGESMGRVAGRMLFRIPAGTVILEELAFRGILPGLLISEGTFTSAIFSGAIFGLWHIVPTAQGIAINRPDFSRKAITANVARGVFLAALAGVVLVYLRIEATSIAAPFALHWVLNALATLAAALALRRAGIVER